MNLARRLRIAGRIRMTGLAALAGLVTACSGDVASTIQQPPRMLFQDAQALEDEGLYTEAIDKFKKVSSENQGTRLGSFAYLRLAEMYSHQEDWLQADTNYRLFLGQLQHAPERLRALSPPDRERQEVVHRSVLSGAGN